VSDVRSKLAEKIKWYRDRAGLSQRALADAIKADKATVWRAEQGDAWPDYKTLEAMASALGVPVDAFFDWGHPPTPQEALRVLENAIAQPRPTEDTLANRVARILADPERADAARMALDAVLDGLEDLPPEAEKDPPEKGK
jgi:transcriptional regulator with XRE-family HTH domain